MERIKVRFYALIFLLNLPFTAYGDNFQHANLHGCGLSRFTKNYWLEVPSDLKSPPGQDISKFEKNPEDLKKISETQIHWSPNLVAEGIQIPKEKVQEFVSISNSMNAAPSYEEGLALLTEKLKETGLVRFYSRFEVTHDSSLPPEVVLKTGIFSAREAEERLNQQVQMTGQRVGDGIYTVGAQEDGWDSASTWGKFRYKIIYDNVWLMHNNNSHANPFLELYLLLRKKWKKSLRDGYDGIMAVGNRHERLASMKWAYEDFGILGASFALEILIKQRVVTPDHIRFVKDLTLQNRPIRTLAPSGVVDLTSDQLSSFHSRHKTRVIDEIDALAKRQLLLNQESPRLRQRGLVIPGGGLCISTAATIVLHAMMRYSDLDTRVFQENPDAIVQRIFDLASRPPARLDARKGLYPDQLAPILKEVAFELGLKISTEFTSTAFDLVTLENLVPTNNRVAIAGLNRGGSMHAITVLFVDTARKTLTYSDPMEPNKIHTVPYWFAEGGYHEKVITLKTPDSRVGFIDGFLAITTEERD